MNSDELRNKYIQETREEIKIYENKLKQLKAEYIKAEYMNNKSQEISDEYIELFKRLVWLRMSCYVNGDLDAMNNIGME